jgi:transposase
MGHHRDKAMSAEAMGELVFLLKEALRATDVKRVQCVYFRGKGMEAEAIAELVQYSVGHVKRMWTQYFAHGARSLLSKPRGGRRHENMTLEEESRLLAAHNAQGEAGKILKIAPLHKSLCEKLGRAVPVSSAYRLAHRHGWRKLEPRPHHPGRRPKAAEYFKVFFPETSRRRTGGSGQARPSPQGDVSR